MARSLSNRITSRERDLDRLKESLIGLGKMLRAEANLRAREYRIQPLAYQALELLTRHRGEDTQEGLANRLGADMGSISTALTLLYRAGLILRSRCTCCARQLVEATELGLELVTVERGTSGLNRATAHLTNEELRQIVAALQQLRASWLKV